MLTIYGTPSCGKCLMLKSKLEKAGIEFRYINISAMDSGELEHFSRETENMTQLPIVWVNEETKYVDKSWVEENLLK